MEVTGFTGVAAITVICLLAAQGVKSAEVISNKWLPLISGLLGGVLGIFGLLYMPDFPAQDWITAMAVGVASGLAATGSHQIIKQLTDDGAL